MVVGILNTFAALARATTLFFSVWRSIDWTPNAICGWWSIKIICEFCGVRTSSFGLVMGDLLRLVCGLAFGRTAPKRLRTHHPPRHRVAAVYQTAEECSTVHCRDTKKEPRRGRRLNLVRRNLVSSE